MKETLSGGGSGFKQWRAAGRGIELLVLSKWGSFGQISDKFSPESPTVFFFLATGSDLLSLWPEMHSWGMSSYSLCSLDHVVAIVCCSYIKLYPNVVNGNFPMSSLSFGWCWRWTCWPVIFVWRPICYFIPNEMSIRIESWLWRSK